jgi:PAS domain S-box-containing protein
METHITSSPQSPFLIGLTRESLESLPWAIAKVARNGVITYGNRMMCEIAGTESVDGKNISDLFHGKDLDVVRHHLESRFTRRAADEYRVKLERLSDHVRVPILCSAMPETNERGKVVGVIAFVRELLTEDVSRTVHKAIEDLRRSEEILQILAKQCQRIVPFDLFRVTLYSADTEHLRELYLFPKGAYRSTVRWDEMTGVAKKLIEAKEVVNIADLGEWLARPEWRRYRKEMQPLLDKGFRSTILYPVIIGRRVVATIGFGRKRDQGPFSKREEQRLGDLPLEAAVRMALHHQQVDELEFTSKLLQQIASVGMSPERIASVLTEQIAAHYEWQNVSILQPDEQTQCIRLVSQQAQKKSFRLPEGWSLPIDQGITGQVYRTKESFNVRDVTAPEFKDIYVSPYAESRSELCIPIIVRDRVYWLLNLEDSKRNAFAKEEEESLRNILHEVSLVLDLASQTQIFSELLKRTKDAVIQTDVLGVIKHTNRATKELLGYSEAQMQDTPFRKYFKDQDQARRVSEAETEDDVNNEEAVLLHKDGSEISLLLSGTSLPKEIGLKIYVCNDISTRKRMETMEILRHMYNEIATQIKTPLSLAFTWLANLQKTIAQPEAIDLLAKTVKQLNKVDLSYERLLFYERYGTIAPFEKRVFDIPFLLEHIKEEMPDSESRKVEVTSQPGVAPVRGDLFQLWFCVESLLAYLLRFVPDSGKISVKVSAQGSGVGVVISGYAPQVTGGAITNYAEEYWAIRAITEMALGEEMIKSFIERNHGGTFGKHRGDGDLIEYTIQLPAA